MVLLLEDESAIIEVKDEMIDGDGEKFLISLPPSSSVQELFTTVDGRNYSPESYNLMLVNEDGETEVKRHVEKDLKEAGLQFGSASKNLLKIVPKKTVMPPSIVISQANKGKEQSAEACNKRIKRVVRAAPSSSLSKRYVGLVNQAMTCYLNSLLQALYMTPEFRNSLYKWEFIGSPEEMPKSIPCQLQKLFLSLQTSSRSAVETSKLTKSFGWDASDSWQQHDIQELCRVMFDALEQRFKETDQADFINNLYQGKMVDYVTCLECKTEKTREDTFLDIPLPVRPFGSTVAYNSVSEAMHAFIQPETLDGNNQYFCEKCNKKCDAHKGLKFSHFPYILTLHLKRFDFDYNAMTRIKLTDRVEFPHILNINNYLCEKAKSSLNKDSSDSCLDGVSNPKNDAIKGNEANLTGTVTKEDVGPQGAELLQGSTSTSNGNGHKEGIDLTDGALNQLNEKKQHHNEGDGPPGPYIYELFSIMIHSGSASGGHYYVYIKDFDKDEWFCFDDQSVSRITNEDISMTYGGASHRGYYSGAHSSSTNAYMLMYRQIDKKRNQSCMNIEEFPSHIKALVKKMQEEEEEERIITERDKDRLRIKVFCEKDTNGRKLVIDGDTTLAEATAIAHKLFLLEVPLEHCRLVSYDSANETMDRSFEGQDEEPMSNIYSSMNNDQSLYLEVREPDAQFEMYRAGDIGIKVYRVNVKTNEVDPPVEVRTQPGETIREMRPKISRAVKLALDMKIMAEECDKSPIELCDEEILPLSRNDNHSTYKIFVSEVSEADSEADLMIKMSATIERFTNTITLYCTLPPTDRESLSEPGITHSSTRDGSKLTNGHSDSTGDSAVISHISRGASPQLPALDGEEECHGSTVCSDQSTSEDSSLTDSDRTIVGDEADYCLAELSPTGSSPPSSDKSNLSSPEEELLSFGKTKQPGKIITAEKNDVCDEEIPHDAYYYLKIHPCISENTVRVHVDKRMLMGTLKAALARYINVAPERLELYRKCRYKNIPYGGLNDPLSHLRDGEYLEVRLGRVLRKGEYQGKVYQLFADDEPIKFLCDGVLSEDMLIGEAKKQILDELRRMGELDIPYERCRLRLKKWKDPGKILMDSQSVQELRLTSIWELYLQELDEEENVTSSSQVTVMLKRFNTLNRPIDEFYELTLQSSSFNELRETLSEISGIPLDSLEFARPLGIFPYMGVNVNQVLQINLVNRELQWETSCNYALEDGTVLYYRNKDKDDDDFPKENTVRSNYRCLRRKERTKEFRRSSDVSDKKLSRMYNQKLSRTYNQSMYKGRDAKANMKDGKALKIYVSPNPESTKENSELDN